MPSATTALCQICRGCDPVIRRHLNKSDRAIKRQPGRSRRPVPKPQRTLDSRTPQHHRLAGLQQLSETPIAVITEAPLPHHPRGQPLIPRVALTLPVQQRSVHTRHIQPRLDARINPRHPPPPSRRQRAFTARRARIVRILSGAGRSGMTCFSSCAFDVSIEGLVAAARAADRDGVAFGDPGRRGTRASSATDPITAGSARPRCLR